MQIEKRKSMKFILMKDNNAVKIPVPKNKIKQNALCKGACKGLPIPPTHFLLTCAWLSREVSEFWQGSICGRLGSPYTTVFVYFLSA